MPESTVISVKERLPEVESSYLVYGWTWVPYDYHWSIADYYEGAGFFCDGAQVKNPTHWAKLPEHPDLPRWVKVKRPAEPERLSS